MYAYIYIYIHIYTISFINYQNILESGASPVDTVESPTLSDCSIGCSSLPSSSCCSGSTAEDSSVFSSSTVETFAVNISTS